MKCARCGEDITAPYQFDGLVYGWTCIKIVKPSATKKSKKTPEYWVKADSVITEEINGKLKVVATYQGAHYKSKRFLDWHDNFNFRRAIILQEGNAFINLYAYPEGKFHLPATI